MTVEATRRQTSNGFDKDSLGEHLSGEHSPTTEEEAVTTNGTKPSRDVIQASTVAGRLEEQLNRRFAGMAKVVRKAVIALIAGGHILLEAVPGVGKTELAKYTGLLIDGDTGRLSMTSDMLPSDITGTQVYRPQDGTFKTKHGPLKGKNVVVADEFNRVSGKGGGAFIEAMAEKKVTPHGADESYDLEDVFTVIATENPIDSQGRGTYPLEHAVLDRFWLRVKYGLPEDEATLIKIWEIDRALRTGQWPMPQPVASVGELLSARSALYSMPFADGVVAYASRLVLATSQHEHVLHGASPRALIMLNYVAAGHALMEGQGVVQAEYVRDSFYDVMNHRLILDPEAVMKGVSMEDVIDSILASA